MRRYEGYVNMPEQHQGVTSRVGAWTKSLESWQQSWSWNLEAHYLQGKILYTVHSRGRWLWEDCYWHEKQIFFLLRGEILRLTNKWQARWMEILFLFILYVLCSMFWRKRLTVSSVEQDTKPCQSWSAFDMLLYYIFLSAAPPHHSMCCSIYIQSNLT